MKFVDFSLHLAELEKHTSRLTITEFLAQLFLKLESSEVAPSVYLLQGRLLPAYDPLEFQLSTKMVLRALALVAADTRADSSDAVSEAQNLFGEVDAGETESEMTQLYKQLGDLGLVAEKVMTARSNHAKSLALLEVYERLKQIAIFTGAGSQDQKVQGLKELFGQLDPLSAKFVTRIVLGNLRLGFATMTILDGLSWAMTGGKGESSQLELAYQKQADLGELAATYLAETDPVKRSKALSTYSVKVGVPVIPALCQRLNSAAEIIEKMHHVLVEPKYDGVRVQIHIQKNAKVQVKTYTRSLEENSHQFPELVSAVETLSCDSCILDAEAIGYDAATGKLLPFQETITRKRKHGVEERALSVPLRFFVFDLLELNGKALIEEKLRDRKHELKNLFKDNEVFIHAPYIETEQPEEVKAFHEQCLADGLEGAVIKQVDSIYQSGRKGWSWVKIKEEEGTRGKLTDTLDCIVVGYYSGKGKRTQFGIGAFLVGVLDSDGMIKTLAKIGTGLSDDQFRLLKQKADQVQTTNQPPVYVVDKALAPDVWLQPHLVVEIAADELTKSPLHTAKWALRFPRLVQFRDDKSWQEATSLAEVEEMAHSQMSSSDSSL